MKSRVLSIVLSLVMVFGVSAGSAYAEADDSRDGNYDIKDKLDRYCDMTDKEKAELVAKHDKSAEHQELMNQYCKLDEEGRDAFIEEHKDEYKSKMKEKMSEFKEEHMKNVDEMKDKHQEIRDHKAEYKRLCSLSEEDRAEEIEDPEKLTKLNEWCAMSPEEQEEYKKQHYDTAMEFKEKHMKNVSEMKEHKKIMRASALTDEQKADIRAKHAELREYKNSLKEQSDLSEEQRKELREEFVEKAKSIKVSWISPRHQVAAGIDAENVECREGFELVMKVSNGNPLCLKEKTAAKLVEKGIVQAI